MYNKSMSENLYRLVKELKKNIRMPFYLRPFRRRLEEAIDTLAQTQAGKSLLMNIGGAPKEIQVKYLYDDCGSYSGKKKILTLSQHLLRKSQRENLVCIIGHELFHKMLRHKKTTLYKKKTSPAQIVTLEVLNETSATAFEKTLLMEAFPDKARQDRNLSETFQLFEKTKKESGLQTAHKKTQAFLVKNILTRQLSPAQHFDWFGSYLHLASMHAKMSFIFDGERVSYEGNDKSYHTILNRYAQMYSPFLKVSDLDKDVISTDRFAQKEVQELTENIRRFKTERPHNVPDTRRARIHAIVKTKTLARD